MGLSGHLRVRPRTERLWLRGPTLPDSILTPLEIIKIFFVDAAGRIAELCYLIEVVAHHAHLPDQLLQLWQLQPEDYFLQSKIPQECAGICIPCFLCPLLNLIALLGGHIELDRMRAFPYTDIISPLRPFGDCADAVLGPFQKISSVVF